jgi:tetratricopeptide (TPR) repeat protein
MTKRIAIFLLSTLMILFTVNVCAQNVTAIKGVCKDENGKLIAGATVEVISLESGHKTTIKTNNKGEYYTMTMSATSGFYKLSLLNPDGSVRFFMDKVPVKLGVDNVYDFDLAKQRREAGKDAGLSEEQVKANEKAKKDNEKIKGLNALLLQAQAQIKDGKYDDAIVTMSLAATPDQVHDIVFGTLAEAYLDARKYPEAETTYNKAIELAPPTSKSLGTYHSNLALVLARQGKSEPALAECNKVAQLDPSQAGQCYYNEGAILTNQGKLDEANQAFDKAIAADPTRAEAYYQKGLNLLGKATLNKEGKMVPVPGTTEALNKYLELAPAGKNAQAAKDLLATLGAPVQTSFGSQKKSGKK